MSETQHEPQLENLSPLSDREPFLRFSEEPMSEALTEVLGDPLLRSRDPLFRQAR